MAAPRIIELKVPPLGESIHEAAISNWYVNAGDYVAKDKLIFDIETDKVTLEVVAPSSGYIDQILAPKNQTVKAGEIVGLLREDETLSQVEATSIQMLNTDPQVSNSQEIAVQEPSISLSVPVSEKVHAEITGERDEKIFQGPEHREPMSRIRRRIAENLKNAQNTAAILTTFNEIDLSAITQLRTQYQKAFTEKYGIKLGWMGFFLQAANRALKAFPIINSRIDGEDIVTSHAHHISVAVSTDDGLVTPVLRHVDTMALPEIEKSLAVLAEKARSRALAPDDLMGGTFTITNGGVFGSLLSTPILNTPQSAILGMHTIQERPVVVNGQITIRPMMYVALSYDHRLIDGRDAVRFLAHIKNTLENPGVLWLGL